MGSDFTHVDEHNRAGMVDVGDKSVTTRIATAEALVFVGSDILKRLQDSDFDSKKGPILQTAILAGTMAAKRTPDLIPLCHPLPLESIKVHIEPHGDACLRVETRVRVTHKTGVEMEALTAASVAALTLIDMCKALSLDLKIEHVRLLEKSGGKRDLSRPATSA